MARNIALTGLPQRGEAPRSNGPDAAAEHLLAVAKNVCRDGEGHAVDTTGSPMRKSLTARTCCQQQ